MQVLLIENALDSSCWLADRLAGSGFVPCQVGSPEIALRKGLTESAAAVILDVGTRGPAGHELIRPLRDAGCDKPLMVLSARGDWRDKVASLDAGADDYLVKPVRSEEVAARLRAIFRRCAGSATGRLAVGDLALDLKATCAWQDGRCLDLTRSEFRLLRILLAAADRVVPRRDLAAQLHFESALRTANALEVLVARLRRKIGHSRIKTVRGLGYRLVLDTRAADFDEASAEPCRHTEPCCG